ncbi:MAG: SRPBCC domain-containing protein [Flavobacteriaceae bacterium]
MRTISWKLSLKSDPEKVFNLLTTAEGIAKFWSEKAVVEDNSIHFVFPNSQEYKGKILKVVPSKEFHLNYFDSIVKFKLEPNVTNGTDLILINEEVDETEFSEVHAGWISVLMNLKAVADFQCDLRNHDPKRTWGQGYVDN